MNKLIGKSGIIYIYNIRIKSNNIEYMIRFYETDIKMLSTLRKLLNNYYLVNGKFNIINIQKENDNKWKFSFPLYVDKNHYNKVYELNQIRYSQKIIPYASNNITIILDD